MSEGSSPQDRPGIEVSVKPGLAHCALAEMETRAVGWRDALIRSDLVVEDVADFAAHAQKRSSGLAWGFPDSHESRSGLVERTGC